MKAKTLFVRHVSAYHGDVLRPWIKAAVGVGSALLWIAFIIVVALENL